MGGDGREHPLSLASFLWHRHARTWGKSDLYYVARLEPASDNEVITACPDEISDCKWMHVDEFLQTQDHPLVTAVLKRVYGLEKGGGGEEAMEGGHRLHAPLVEMLEAGVQWPEGSPILRILRVKVTVSSRE